MGEAEEEARCEHCLRAVPDELGFENHRGDVLCGPCYFVLWGPKGQRAMSAESDRRRPGTRRSLPGRTIWIPGPTGELDPRPNP